jgi:hypothetical protein
MHGPAKKHPESVPICEPDEISGYIEEIRQTAQEVLCLVRELDQCVMLLQKVSRENIKAHMERHVHVNH